MNEWIEARIEGRKSVDALVRADDVVVGVLLPGTLVSGHLADDCRHPEAVVVVTTDCCWMMSSLARNVVLRRY